jgi:hypothetical protein
MPARSHPLFLWVFLLILAPLAAVVVISALMLFGVPPQLVFAPGRAVKSLLELSGLHIANRVAVISTAAAWWIVFAGIGSAWERRRR